MPSRATLMTVRLATLAGAAVACVLYLSGLGRMGLVSTDEPRYAAVAKAMADSGDWVTPRLWGKPWFEKPALLYWMSASGFRLGLGPELAPRLPVALLSLGFLGFFWWRARAEWDARIATGAVVMLATSAGWLAYSHVAVTDLPLAVFFSMAVLLAVPWARRGEAGALTAASACLGLAVLAKGLVPLVLFLPVLGMGWRGWREWLRPGPVLAFGVTAIPWYILCTLRNGSEFPKVFFLEHHFQRFSTSSLQHVQPWWYYLPVLLLLLYPWFPVLALARTQVLRDSGLRIHAVVAAFGFVFFSASVNKLPGYLLPLLPSICLFLSASVARSGLGRPVAVAVMGMLGLLAPAASIVPAALDHGFKASLVPWAGVGGWFCGAAVAGGLICVLFRKRPMAAAACAAAVCYLWFEMTAFPAFDRAASGRPLWLASKPVCAPRGSRGIRYSLSYYAGIELGECPSMQGGHD